MAKRELRLGAGLNGNASSAAELRLNRPRPPAARARDWELDLVLLVGPRAAPDARTHCQIGPSPTALELGSHLTRCWREMDSNFRYRGRRPASGRSLHAQRVETDAAKREFGSGSCLFAPPWGGSGGLGGGLCFPFSSPGNGQQESRLAPIGRHLRLLRRGVLRTGCFPRQAAFQGGHEIDDGWRGRDLPGFNGEPLHLGFD